LLHRHVKFALLRKLQDEDFGSSCGTRFGGKGGHPFIKRNPMMQMNDIIPIRDLGKIKRLVLAAQADQPLLLAQCPHGLVAAKDFRIAQYCKLSFGPDKAAQQGANQKCNRFDGDLSFDEDFFETFVLTFVVAEDRDFPALSQPVA